ncbi:MAG: hypothetical protein IKL36_06365 [Clostridia bacterium]|nr:hypothetical protein [Clostridia bacterium]
MKKYLMLVPAILFPYISFGIFWHLDGEKSGFGGLLLGIIMAFLVCFACTLVFSVICVKRQVGSTQIMNAARIVKLLHIPAYLLVFLWGFLSMGMTATMIMLPIGAASLFVCWLLDVFCIIVSGMVSSVAYYRAWREGKIILARALISAILSFVFCVDVIIVLIGFAGTKKD